MGKAATAVVAKGFHARDQQGKLRLFQERGRACLPVLVRQAHAQAPITYGNLAAELGIPNPRTLNFPLGSVGASISWLSSNSGNPIPPIQSLVINDGTALPGPGFINEFADQLKVEELTPGDKRRLTQAWHADVYAFPRWNRVLDAFDLKPLVSLPVTANGSVLSSPLGGESEAHRRLKFYVAANPSAVGLKMGSKAGSIEVSLHSGDKLDVSFQSGSRWVAGEVKSRESPRDDIIRGLYQCVKYVAVMGAMQVAGGGKHEAEARLVLEGQLPHELIALRNMLGVQVVENVAVPADFVVPERTS